MNNDKMIRTAGTLDTFVKVAGGICKVCAIVVLVFAVLVAVLGGRMVDTGSLSVDLDFVKVYLAPEYRQITGPVRAYICAGLLAVAFVLALMWMGSRSLRGLLAPMKQGRPFEAEAPAHLRRLAWLVLAGGGFTEIMGMVQRMIMTRVLPVRELFVSPAVERIEYAYTLDYGFVAAFMVIMFLSYVFAYGQRLQREADETL